MSEARETARLAVFDYITETLLDLADPAPEEENELRDNMANAADIILEGLDVKIVKVDDNGLIHATISLGEDPTE